MLGYLPNSPSVAENSSSKPVGDLPIGRKARISSARVNWRPNNVDVSNLTKYRCRAEACGSTTIREDFGCSNGDCTDQPKEGEYLQLKGCEMEAYIYDPLYVDFEQEGNCLGESEDDWPIKIYDLTRLESSQFRFYENAVPMETLNGIKPVGQASPLFYRPFLC